MKKKLTLHRDTIQSLDSADPIPVDADAAWWTEEPTSPIWFCCTLVLPWCLSVTAGAAA